ncbi:GGDEF domain-containing response regulator [Aphanothece sacrum]|uniref:Two-component response regulator n=1 Tax=Aphanothece sacrum FPU1 TaxID=1920663 RepID=A0A401ILP5_APHSA|nr:diguanylate cyclase [Aphanothece sacrum]GBF82169.1 two-component response regulator [Aphanothece sacrum FPU1]GBF85881.1 two-component response regulator [Aphanothece sacrum FPU3]
MNLQSCEKADILIIDDQIDNLRLLSNLLAKRGYRVRQAVDGEMALIAIDTETPDVILLDIKIPRLDGYGVCSYLKKNEKTAEIPVIFLSAFDEILEKTKAFEVGGVDYITKPYHTQEVLARVETQVKLSLLHQKLQSNNRYLKRQLKLSEAAQEFHAQPQIDAYLLHQAIAATYNGIIITDATHSDNPIIYANPGFERMTGYSLEEVKGKNCRFLQGSDREQSGILELHNCIQEKRECSITVRNYRKDGILFWNEVSLSPVKDESGQVVYYIGVQTDVTQRKLAEEERQRYEASVHKMNRELHELNTKLHRLANLDGLTEVANRRCFDETLEHEWRRLSREKQPLSLILGDIDYFKLYNDNYGHLSGDDCLKKVAQAISSVIHRPADLVARYGGEEFAIILPNTPTSGAMQVAQKILEEIRQLQLPHKASKVQSYVTMSLGVGTVLPTLGISETTLINQADEFLFQAKKEGRDRVVSYPV